jgi:hypothetical protein
MNAGKPKGLAAERESTNQQSARESFAHRARANLES